MKTTTNILKIAAQTCWLCVHIVVALWAIRQMVIMTRLLKTEYRNKDIVIGRIVQ